MDQVKTVQDTRRKQFAYAGLLAAAAVIVATLTGCAGVPSGMQPPTVTIADIGVGNAGLFEQQFNVKLRIQNPNPDDFRVNGIAFDLDVNGQPFAKGVGGQTVTVPRFGSDFMAVEAVSTLGGLLKQIGRAYDGNKTVFKYRIKGQLSIDGGSRVPFEENGEFDFGVLLPKGLPRP